MARCSIQLHWQTSLQVKSQLFSRTSIYQSQSLIIVLQYSLRGTSSVSLNVQIITKKIAILNFLPSMQCSLQRHFVAFSQGSICLKSYNDNRLSGLGVHLMSVYARLSFQLNTQFYTSTLKKHNLIHTILASRNRYSYCWFSLSESLHFCTTCSKNNKYSFQLTYHLMSHLKYCSVYPFIDTNLISLCSS